MKKTTFCTALFVIAIFLGLFGQNSMTFTFTAVKGPEYYLLDSLRVRNITQACDTLLIYPDTVLIVNYVRINENQTGVGGSGVIRSYPNPVNRQTTINLDLPEKEVVNLALADAAGHLLYSDGLTLDQGTHAFLFTPPVDGLYLFNASWKTNSFSTRILACGVTPGSAFSLQYNGMTTPSKSLKSDESVTEFLFSPGDELMLIGYGEGLESGFIDSPETDRDYVFQFATNIPCPGLDSLLYDGQWYHTIQVFSQCWMKENLNAGVMISYTQAQTDNDIIEKYCMSNNETYCGLLGGLYFWNEMMNYVNETGGRGICPDGFHVPTDLEWQVLEGAADSLLEIGSTAWNANGWRGNDAGGNLKQTGTELWEPPNTGATNAVGFTTVPAGYFVQGDFWGPGYKTYLWSSNVAGKYYRNMDWNQAGIQRNTGGTGTGFSVRCIKD